MAALRVGKAAPAKPTGMVSIPLTQQFGSASAGQACLTEAEFGFRLVA
jgi:hypothetical protein